MASTLKTARPRPTGGGTCHLDRPHVPARITQGRIERSVVTAQDHRAVVGDQSPDQFLMIAIVELMLVTARLARAGHVGRIAVCQPAVAAEPLEDVAPVAALDLDALHPLVDARQVVKAADPLRRPRRHPGTR